MALSQATVGAEILIIKTPTFPQFQFEWHPGKRKVYLTRIGSTIGEAIAFEIKTHGDAQNAVWIWLRGYRQAKLEIEGPGELLKLE